jgi:sarcosine oxidase, subunit gamma
MLEPWLRVLPSATRFVFQGDAEARTAASTAWGVPFAEQACRAKTADERATLWLGPDEYLLWDGASGADPGGAAALAAAIERALGELPHALVDVSRRQIAMRLSGPRATDILSGGCPLDLDLEQFPVGACTRTVFAKADIVLWRTAPETFHLEVGRSFGAYVSGLLEEIALDITGPG